MGSHRRPRRARVAELPRGWAKADEAEGTVDG